jgi:hypothetical protein
VAAGTRPQRDSLFIFVILSEAKNLSSIDGQRKRDSSAKIMPQNDSVKQREEQAKKEGQSKKEKDRKKRKGR